MKTNEDDDNEPPGTEGASTKKGTKEGEQPNDERCADNTEERNGGIVRDRRPPRDFVSDTYRTIPATSSKVPTTRRQAGEEDNDTDETKSPASSPHRSPRYAAVNTNAEKRGSMQAANRATEDGPKNKGEAPTTRGSPIRLHGDDQISPRSTASSSTHLRMRKHCLTVPADKPTEQSPLTHCSIINFVIDPTS